MSKQTSGAYHGFFLWLFDLRCADWGTVCWEFVTWKLFSHASAVLWFLRRAHLSNFQWHPSSQHPGPHTKSHADTLLLWIFSKHTELLVTALSVFCPWHHIADKNVPTKKKKTNKKKETLLLSDKIFRKEMMHAPVSLGNLMFLDRYTERRLVGTVSPEDVMWRQLEAGFLIIRFFHCQLRKLFSCPLSSDWKHVRTSRLVS